jgi:DNA-binding response OmpR family regulator
VNNRAKDPGLAQYALWNAKKRKGAPQSKRVFLAYADKALGESLVSLFELKGFPAQYALDVASLDYGLRTWNPQVIFLDTRIAGCGNYALVRSLRESDDGERRLIIAMSGFLPEEPVHLLKEAGYDGHCRRPCRVWQMTDLLDEIFARGSLR